MLLEPIDWSIVALYAIGTFSIAFWAMRKINNVGGLLVGSRKLGRTMTIASAFAGGTNANHPMAVASATFERGLSGMWLSLTWILITPFFWLYPPLVRRLRIVTMIDVVRMRFGTGMEYVFKTVLIITTPLSMALGIKSAALVIEVMTGGALSGWQAEAAIAIPTLVYALMGGVIAAYATDVLQGLMIIVLSFLLIPFAIAEAGSIAALDAGIDDRLTQLISSEAGNFGPWWIFWFAIGVTTAAVIASAGGASAAKDEMTSRMKVFGLVAKRFCTVGWGLAGLFGIALFASHPMVVQNTDNIFPVVSAELLPVVLRGLMVASILAAVMSSLDGSILNFGGMVVNNVYQQHLVREATPSHYLLMARVFAAVGLILGWWIASSIGSIVQFTKYVEPVSGLIGVPLLAALLWRRVTAAGAITSVLIMAPLFWYTARVEYPGGVEDMTPILGYIVEAMQSFYAWTGHDVAIIERNKLDVPYMYPIYLIPGFITIVGVSLFTQQHNKHSVAQFYKRLDTPVGREHEIAEAGFEADQLIHLDNEIPVGEIRDKRPDRLLMKDLLYLPGLLKRGEVKWSDYRWDLIGTAGSIIFVIAFIWMINFVGSLL